MRSQVALRGLRIFEKKLNGCGTNDEEYAEPGGTVEDFERYTTQHIVNCICRHLAQGLCMREICEGHTQG